jgi:hypothetical protein
MKDAFECCNTEALIAHRLRILFWRRKIPAQMFLDENELL